MTETDDGRTTRDHNKLVAHFNGTFGLITWENSRNTQPGIIAWATRITKSSLKNTEVLLGLLEYLPTARAMSEYCSGLPT